MQAILKTSICFLLCIKTINCCDCNLEEMIKDTVIKSSSNTMEKRQMHDDEDDSAEVMRDSEITERTTNSMDETTKVNKVIFKSTELEKDSDKNDCPYFKEMPEYNFDKMVDVWKITFYKASEKLSCFKIHIKKTSMEDRKMGHKIYGDFNGSIDWKNCQFEVASSALKQDGSEQRHFLEGSKNDKGVFKNVIVTREETSNLVTLLDQSPDQWLVISNLLLMRDCDNGDVVVFSRLPMEPSLRDIEDALAIFGEDASNGTMACEALRIPKYQTLS